MNWKREPLGRAGGRAGDGLPSGGGQQDHPSASSPGVMANSAALYERGLRPQHRSARGAFSVETVTRAWVPGCAEGCVKGRAGTRTCCIRTQRPSLCACPEHSRLWWPGLCVPPNTEATTLTGGPGGRGLGDEALLCDCGSAGPRGQGEARALHSGPSPRRDGPSPRRLDLCWG